MYILCIYSYINIAKRYIYYKSIYFSLTVYKSLGSASAFLSCASFNIF